MLTAAGHPRCKAQSVVQRMNIYGDRDDDARNLNGLTLRGLRERYCYPCRPSEGFSDGPNHRGIRECDIIDCPVWPYRLGFNPHNPQRGRDPFGERGRTARGQGGGDARPTADPGRVGRPRPAAGSGPNTSTSRPAPYPTRAAGARKIFRPPAPRRVPPPVLRSRR